jgi:hypothetical protein
MLPGDRVVKPKSGFFFPFSLGEPIGRIESVEFEAHYQPRINALLLNDYGEFEPGALLASFAERSYLAIFSLPEDVSREVARAGLDETFRRFADIEKRPGPRLRQHQIVLYRAYLKPFNAIVITRDVINLGFQYGWQTRDALWPTNVKSMKHKETSLWEGRLRGLSFIE